MKRFTHWLVNSFWYHYKWQTLGVLVVLGFAALFIHDLATRENPDCFYLLVHEDMVIDEQLAELDALAAESLPDANGDGRVIVRGQAVSLYDGWEIGAANRVRLQAMLMDETVVLYLIDEANADQLTEMMGELFGPLADWGLPSDEDCPWRLRVEDYPLVRRMGFSGETPLYACLRVCGDGAREDPETTARYEAAAAVIELILEAA